MKPKLIKLLALAAVLSTCLLSLTSAIDWDELKARAARVSPQTNWILFATNYFSITNVLQPEYSFQLIVTPDTNWTGYNFQGKELGFVVTNHIAQITGNEVTNRIQLKSIPSKIAVWREWQNLLIMTNANSIRLWEYHSITNIHGL